MAQHTLLEDVLRVYKLVGLRLDSAQASCIAAIYRYQRPIQRAVDVAAALARMPDLPWMDDETDASKLEITFMIVGWLDQGYWIDTFEHDAVTGMIRS